MTRKRWGSLGGILVICLCLGGLLSFLGAARQGASIQRFQLSAYGGQVDGCYVLDTYTGEVWHCRRGVEAIKVAGVLDAE